MALFYAHLRYPADEEDGVPETFGEALPGVSLEWRPSVVGYGEPVPYLLVNTESGLQTVRAQGHVYCAVDDDEPCDICADRGE